MTPDIQSGLWAFFMAALPVTSIAMVIAYLQAFLRQNKVRKSTWVIIICLGICAGAINVGRTMLVETLTIR